MAVLSFKDRIIDLAGALGTADDNAIQQWLIDGCYDVINKLQTSRGVTMPAEFAVQSGQHTSSMAIELDTIRDVISVERDGIQCKLIPFSKSKYANPNTTLGAQSIYKATGFDPVFYKHNNLLVVLPNPTTTEPGYYSYIPEYSVDSWDSTSANISKFPKQYVEHIVLYAAIVTLDRQLLDLIANTDITTAFTTINTELDETQVICDLINTQSDSAVLAISSANTEIGLANAELDKMATETGLNNAEIDLAKAEILEAVTQVDAGIDTALSAINDAADRVNVAVELANAEFDKCDTMLQAGESDTEGAVNTALGLIKDAVDQAETAGDQFATIVFGDSDTFDTAAAQLTRVKNALNNAENVINGDQPSSTTDAFGALADEDTEIMQGALSIASTEIKRAQAHMGEWTGIGDMIAKQVEVSLREAGGYVQEIQIRLSQAQAKRDESRSRIDVGNAYLQEASASAKEAQTYVQEVSSRVSQVDAQLGVAQGYIASGGGYSKVADGYAKAGQGYISTASSYLQTVSSYLSAAQGYSNEIQAKIGITQGYAAEAKIRMERDNQQYQWYQEKRNNLKQEYISKFPSQGTQGGKE